MKHFVLTALSTILAVLGIAGLVQSPISDCSQVYNQGAPVSFAAFVLFGLLIWFIPAHRFIHLKVLTTFVMLLLALVVCFRPTMMAEYRRDVIGCVNSGGDRPELEGHHGPEAQ
jgi:hypothetical protein